MDARKYPAKLAVALVEITNDGDLLGNERLIALSYYVNEADKLDNRFLRCSFYYFNDLRRRVRRGDYKLKKGRKR